MLDVLYDVLVVVAALQILLVVTVLVTAVVLGVAHSREKRKARKSLRHWVEKRDSRAPWGR